MQGFRSVCVMLVVTGLGSLVAPGRTEAGLLRLNMSGETFPGSEIAGSPITNGTPWSLAAEFDTASLTEGSQGLYSAPTNSLTVVIGATTYTATAPGSMNVLLGIIGEHIAHKSCPITCPNVLLFTRHVIIIFCT